MPQYLNNNPAGEYAAPILVYEDDNPFWFPRFLVHGAGSATNPYMVCSDDPDCSPCSRQRRRKLIKQLKLGSQAGSIN